MLIWRLDTGGKYRTQGFTQSDSIEEGGRGVLGPSRINVSRAGWRSEAVQVETETEIEGEGEGEGEGDGDGEGDGEEEGGKIGSMVEEFDEDRKSGNDATISSGSTELGMAHVSTLGKLAPESARVISDQSMIAAMGARVPGVSCERRWRMKTG